MKPSGRREKAYGRFSASFIAGITTLTRGPVGASVATDCAHPVSTRRSVKSTLDARVAEYFKPRRRHPILVPLQHGQAPQYEIVIIV